MKGHIADIIEEVQSNLIHIVHVVNGERKSSGTGFKVNGYLVTNCHVIYDAPADSKIILKNSAGKEIIELKRDEHGKFSGQTNKGYKNEEGDFIKDISCRHKKDYIIFNIPELKEAGLRNFELSPHTNKRVGEEVFFLGYHLHNDQLACHTGTISCVYPHQNRKVDIIQLDASVNNGNSGSPLIDPITSKVIGIITQKESGLSNNFNDLNESIEETKKELEKNQKNIDVLKQNINSQLAMKMLNEAQESRLNGGAGLGINDAGILIKEADITFQIIESLSNSTARLSDVSSKLSDITKEIKRSANVGIGYAYSVEHLIKKTLY